MAIQIRRGTNSEWESNKSNIVVGEPAVATDSARAFIGTASGSAMELANINTIAPPFDSSKTYNVGNVVNYQGSVYVFTATHSGAWSSGDVTKTTVSDAVWQNGYNDFESTTVNGVLCSFDNGAGGIPVKSMKVSVDAMQSGSGDPSPTNVRPITGWTGANIQRTTFNILPPKSYWALQGATFELDENTSTFTLTNTASSGYRQIYLDSSNAIDMPVGKNRKMKMYCKFTFSNSDITPRIYLLDQTGADFGVLARSDSETWKTINVPDTVTKCRVIIRMSQNSSLVSGDVVAFENLQVHFDGTPDTLDGINYSTMPITWTSAGTVYGGTLDVTSGVLTVTHTILTAANGTNPTYGTSGSVPYLILYLPYSGTEANAPTICSSYVQILTTTTGTSGHYRFYTNRAVIYDSRFTRKDQALGLLTTDDFKLVYPLATPQTYQLTATQVETLLHDNNIWADCGEIDELTYRISRV